MNASSLLAAMVIEIQGCAMDCSGYQYGFTFEEEIAEDDFVIENEGIKIIVDMISSQYLQGATLDYKEEKFNSQFVISNPNAKSTCGCGSSFNA
jgi:iron-sulfur cluster insertion protein